MITDIKIVMEELVRTLGIVKQTEFSKDFDNIIDKFKEKAIRMGYNGELVFKKEHNKVVIMVLVKDKRYL